jgi:hypothetical protein
MIIVGVEMMLVANIVGTSYAFFYPKPVLKSTSDHTNNYTINGTSEVEGNALDN